MTLPLPIWKEKTCCPGSLVLKNDTNREIINNSILIKLYKKTQSVIHYSPPEFLRQITIFPCINFFKNTVHAIKHINKNKNRVNGTKKQANFLIGWLKNKKKPLWLSKQIPMIEKKKSNKGFSARVESGEREIVTVSSAVNCDGLTGGGFRTGSRPDDLLLYSHFQLW